MERELIPTFVDEYHVQHYKMTENRPVEGGFTLCIECPNVVIKNNELEVLAGGDESLVKFTAPSELDNL